ncbi:MAG: hypothetical protein ACXVZN_05800 [Gaiellaceae bacterium]
MHIGALKRGARAFVNGDPYTFEIERNMDVIPWEFALYATPIRNPKNNLGSIVGDAVNNLRAALDNLVWELGDLDRGPPPPDPIPRGNPWRRVSFPIVLDETKMGNTQQEEPLGRQARSVAEFEKLQPFRRRKLAPHRDEFAVLDELWSIDKHRHPHIVGAFVGLHSLGPTRWPFPGEAPEFGFTFEILEQRPVGPFKRRTKLGVVREVRIHPKPPGAIITTSAPEMHMNPRLLFDIAFEKGPPAYGRRVIETLEACRDAVTDALVRFEPEFR